MSPANARSSPARSAASRAASADSDRGIMVIGVTRTPSVTPTSMSPLPQVLLISGSLREGSTNTAVLRTATELAGGVGVATTLYRGMADLPHFNPDDDREGEPVHAAVAELRAQIAAADAVLCARPNTPARYPERSRTCSSGPSATAAPTASRSPGSTHPDPPRPPAARTHTTRCARSSATSTPTSSRKPARASP